MLPKIKSATGDDLDRLLNTVTLGFAADPMVRWTWPLADVYAAAMPTFTKAFGGAGLDHDTIYVAEEGRAAAFWLPPEAEPDGETLAALVIETAEEAKQPQIFDILQQMEAFHPKEPCWHLAVIAADPAHMGQGLGAALMKHALERCDADGLPAYLESSNPRNMTLYERHGFEAIGEIRAGTSPVMTPMLRAPRK